MAYDGGMASLKIIARLGILWASLAMLALPAAVQAQDFTYETNNGANSHGLDPRVKRVLQAHKQDQWDLDISKLKMMSEDVTGFENGTQEVWKVVEGTGLITGLKVTHGDQTLEAKSIVKFNEMIFHIGRRMWLLRQAGSKNPDFEGELPNQPAN